MGVDDGAGAELVEFNHHFTGAFPVHVTIAVECDVVVDFYDHFSIVFISFYHDSAHRMRQKYRNYGSKANRLNYNLLIILAEREKI